MSQQRRQPALAVDCIVRSRDRILIIERRRPPFGWALPGGMVEYGETVESAVRREVLEETGVELTNLRLFGVYSDPARDPRGHCVSVVFVADAMGSPAAGDDAKAVQLIDIDDPNRPRLVFDHETILSDYRKSAPGRAVQPG